MTGGQGHPDEHAALRPVPPAALGQRGRQAFEHGVPALLVRGPHHADVRVEVAVAQVSGGRGLVDGRRVQVGGLLGDHTGAAQPGGGAQEPEPEARGHHLRERTEQHGAVGGHRIGGDPRHALALETQFAVRVVLDDPESEPRRRLGDGLPAAGGKGAARGVLEGGHDVEEGRLLARRDLFERLGDDALVVGGHGDDPRAGEAEGLQGREVAGVLDEHDAARLDERRGQERERLLRTRGDQQVVGVGGEFACGEPRRYGGTELGVALGGRVLEGVLRVVRQHTVVRRPDARDVEQLGGGQPAGERDHLGPRGQRQDLPYRRRADACQPRGGGGRGHGGRGGDGVRGRGGGRKHGVSI